MKKYLPYIITALAAATAGVLVSLMFRKKSRTVTGEEVIRQQTQKGEGAPTVASGDDIVGSKDKLLSDTFPLRSGSRGFYVLMTQVYLNVLYNAGLKLDGIMGYNTIKAFLTNTKIFGVIAGIDPNWIFKQSDYDNLYDTIKKKTLLKKMYQYIVSNDKQINSVLTLYGLRISQKVYDAAK